MKSPFTKLVLFSHKVTSRHIQVALAMLALVLFVLGAGAPDSPGPVGR
jgi:hypothetical protein